MTPEQNAMVMGLIVSAFPSWKPTKETVALYGKMLDDIPFSVVRDTVLSLIALDDKPPTIARIRKVVAQNFSIAAPLTSDAWLEVKTSVSACGARELPIFSHDAIRQTVAVIGWKDICTSTNEGVTRAHFFKVYDEVSSEINRRLVNEPLCLPLAAEQRALSND